ncbi:MAG: DUF1905 domain-containing protein [Candidatus Micrarchaeota archaeon]
MARFSAKVRRVGVNPCVYVPEGIVLKLHGEAKKKGPVPVRGKLQGKPFRTTVVRYRHAWLLYLNGDMRRESGVSPGDWADIEVRLDSEPRAEPMPKALAAALADDRDAGAAFRELAPSHRKEILRYLNYLKTQEALGRNIRKVIRFLKAKKAGTARRSM